SAVSGKIALVDRGNCGFAVKVANAAAAGAVGVIGANNTGGTTGTSMAPGTPCLTPNTAPCTIRSRLIAQNPGVQVKGALAAGTVNVELKRDADGVDRDGTIDNQVVAHEWGHYLSNRLIGDANGISTHQSFGMGEGWGDFVAQLMTVRDGENWSGAYPT